MATENHGKVFDSRRGSVTFWSLAGSIIIHLLALAVFTIAGFSRTPSCGATQPFPAAKVTRIKKMAAAVPLIPKPAIKKHNDLDFASRHKKILPVKQIFSGFDPGVRQVKDLAKRSDQQQTFSRATRLTPNRTHFYGSWTAKRRVCYVVDCSGSMKGVFASVTENLKNSIASLQPDQYFYIIFFGGDKLTEAGGGRLMRATTEAKTTAFEFIDSAKASGQTNAIEALERAFDIGGTAGTGPSVIYFLTDGFELTSENKDRFRQRIINMLNNFSPQSSINTIAFWPQQDDRKMLSLIAEQTGGEAVFVTDKTDN